LTMSFRRKMWLCLFLCSRFGLGWDDGWYAREMLGLYRDAVSMIPVYQVEDESKFAFLQLCGVKLV
jgi:hypothetical protein